MYPDITNNLTIKKDSGSTSNEANPQNYQRHPQAIQGLIQQNPDPAAFQISGGYMTSKLNPSHNRWQHAILEGHSEVLM